MKRLITLSLLLLLATACADEEPGIRVRNLLDVKANVQLKPDVGSTININDVAAGSTSEEMIVQEGRWTASATIQSSNAEPEAVFDVKNDYRYTVVLVNADPPVIEVQSEGK
jgi:hypothetical protein